MMQSQLLHQPRSTFAGAWRYLLPGLALLLLVSPTRVSAQERVWVEGGLGPGAASGDRAAALVSLQYEPSGAERIFSSVSLRGSVVAEILGSETFWDIGVLVGPTWRWGGAGSVGHARAALQAGVGLSGMAWEDSGWNFPQMSMRGRLRTQGPLLYAQGSDGPESLHAPVDPSWSAVGIPLAASVSWQPAGFIGLGLGAFANANPRQSFGGLGALLQVGRVR